MSEVTDKKETFTSAEEVYYNEISRYVQDVYDRFPPIDKPGVEKVLFVIHGEWLERLAEQETN